ncbi:MAG: 4-(cytidine 5'-diphospho)-2-C-methyl-D-erythritol kinase [Rhodobacteraceae bacterium]|nr:4-(cytidine 5'-diphospho)-2-C-methyl-D-erythritol kinase [Paracoccaceae bacterium]
MAPAAVEAFAPAKINLALHVIGQRADSYHLLDSLVVFADVGDSLRVQGAGALTLEVTGPRAAGVPCDADNLVLRAAHLLAPGQGARITLEKRLPVASGIGGGSADAAAALRALSQLWGRALPAAVDVLALGADVPACLDGRPLRMGGIGEHLVPLLPLPPVWLVLANPGVAVATPSVFRALVRRDNAGLPPDPPRVATAADLAVWLRLTRNDLEAAALTLAPVIGAALRALSAQPGCLLARMSGSGATCFGLFADPLSAAAAARAIGKAEPGWWVADAGLAPPQATRATT